MQWTSAIRSVRRPATVMSLLFLASFSAFGCSGSREDPSFQDSVVALRESVAEVNRGELERLADVFAGFVDDGRDTVRALYGEAVAAHASIWTPTFGNPGLDTEEITARLQRSSEALDALLEERPGLVEARALALFNRMLTTVYEDEEARPALQERQARRALQLVERHPDHPGALTVRAFAILQASPATFAQEGAERFVRARQEIAKGAPPDLLATGVWKLLPLVLSARTNMFVLRDFREAKRAADTGASLDPPPPPLQTMSERLRNAVGHTAVARDALPAGPWRLLATDPEGDVQPGAAADGKRLSYHLSDDGRTVWIKFQTHNPFPVDGFGVNLVIDDVSSSGSGRSWWGANSDFVFDRLVTVWVRRHESGAYDGWVGVTEAEAAMEQDLGSVLRGGLAFSVLEDENAVVVGVPRSALPRSAELRVIGAVGSTVNWSDDLPDDGPVPMSLEG